MRHMKTVREPAKTREVVDYETCDICGDRILENMYEVNEVEVRHKTGSSFPEGGSGDEVEFDLCGKCFTEKLIPWLSTQGAEPRRTEWDW